MAGKLTLIYLNGKGRGEHIRLILAAAGREYEDKRISEEEFAAFRSSKNDEVVCWWVCGVVPITCGISDILLLPVQ